jgi:hypothetical protein
MSLEVQSLDRHSTLFARIDCHGTFAGIVPLFQGLVSGNNLRSQGVALG